MAERQHDSRVNSPPSRRASEPSSADAPAKTGGGRTPVSRWGRFLRSGAPWIAIMMITSGFHFFRGATVDGVIFLVVALLLLLDDRGVLPRTRLRPRLPQGAALIAIAVVLGVPLVLAPRYGVAVTIILSGLGAAILVAAWPDPPVESGPTRSATERPDRASRAWRRAAVLWIILGLLVCLWELAAYFLGRPSPAAEYDFPPLSDLIGPMLDTLVGRTLLVAAWIVGGSALLHRGRTS